MAQDLSPGVTPRAYLAPLDEQDARHLYEWINDRSLVNLSAPFHPVHAPDHEAWFTEVRRRKDIAIFGIRRTDTKELVGTCQLCAIDPVHRSAELRIRIGVESARGIGLGQDACRALLQHAFADLNLHRVYLYVFNSNIRAKRAYEKVGFVVEGVARHGAYINGRWEDVTAMAIVRDDGA